MNLRSSGDTRCVSSPVSKARNKALALQMVRRMGSLQRSLASCAVLAASGALVCSAALAQRIPAIALPNAPVTAGGVRQPFTQPQRVYGFDNNPNPYAVNGNVGTITQTSQSGILRWDTFDIGADGTVNIIQPNSSAVLLNRVDGGYYQNQTVIEGILNSSVPGGKPGSGGQVYIYNPNGIIFGKSARVNVGALLASTLNIDNRRFISGILAPNDTPILAADPALAAPPGDIAVDAGGSITSADGGRILLAAPNVTNNGLLFSPNGQVILAAGEQVFLSSPTDISMRGLLVEVNNPNLAGTTGSAATNLGQILVGHGNATMVGLAVNQQGLVSATTSVSENGSIYLHARDGAAVVAQNTPAVATRGGNLLLGAGSVTEIKPEYADIATTPVSSKFIQSQVDLSGNTIHLQGNATVRATSGSVVANASSVPVKTLQTTPDGVQFAPNGNSQIYLDSGSVIDVSGSTNTELAMESNVIQVQLRGAELADTPLLRNSALRGQTVSIDIRKGTPLANVQGYLDQVQQGIGQRTASGGGITLNAGTAVVVNEGAELNVSGGQVRYKAGYIATSGVTFRGVTTDIGSATPDRLYTGVVAPVAGPGNYNPGYVQGYDAGSITLDAPALVTRGKFIGVAGAPGPQQRDTSAASTPNGGLLVLGNANTAGNLSNLHFAGALNFGDTATDGTVVPAFDAANPAAGLPQPLRDTTAIAMPNLTGFNRLQAYADEGTVTLSRALDLAPGGEFTVSGRNGVNINAGITAPGGKVAASAQTGVNVADGVSIDVAGRWTNDRADAHPRLDAQGNPTAPIVLNGGSISLTAAGSTNTSVTIGSGVTLDASGGAWLDAQGKQKAGNGGSIKIGPAVGPLVDPSSSSLRIGDNLILKAYSLVKGGSLQVSAPNVKIGALSSDPAILGLDRTWFQQGGFASYGVSAAGNLTVTAGTKLNPRTDNWVGNRDTASVASGRMDDAFDVATLGLTGPQGTRKAASVSLQATGENVAGLGVLDVERGAAISVDPGGSINLTGGTQLTVDGTLTAPGGAINLSLSPGDKNRDYAPYLPGRSIWLGSGSVLDVSGSSALLWQNPQGLTQGNLLDGGQINIGHFDSSSKSWTPLLGYVVANPDAYLNASGATAQMTMIGGRRGGGKDTVQAASGGGSINILSLEGLLLDGKFNAAGGNSTARGGSLSLALDPQGFAVAGYPSAPLNFVVSGREPAPGTPGNGVIPATQPGQSLDSAAGQGFVLADSINAGQFDNVRIKSAGNVDFDLSGGNLTLAARSALVVDTPAIASRNVASGGGVRLNAPYVQLGNSDWRLQSAVQTAANGAATLTVNAKTLDLIGHSALSGFNGADFNVGGDTRLIGQVDFDLNTTAAAAPPPVAATGSFTVDGSVKFTAAQIYPVSLSDFSLNATGANGAVSFFRSGNTAAIPLSALGSLTVNAKDITQNGVVRAPLGTIDFEASRSLSYGTGSLTSVAGSATVPLGFVQNGRDWLYDFGNGHSINLSDPKASNYVALPGKNILSRGPAVSFSKGATLDLSGGGDLYAYEFTPGPGGSRDVLASASGSYAVLPGYNGPVAPSDYQYQYGQAGNVNPGDKVYLSGIAGLPAGYYTLLPSHYALQPGAFLLNAVAGSPSLAPSAASQNYQTAVGTWQVAGYRSSLGGGTSGLWQNFVLTPSTLVRQESEYGDYQANAFLNTSPSLPKNGGHVAFSVTESLTLAGLVKLGATPGGANGIADISAPEITVVGDQSQSVGSGVKLVAADLMAIGADSLLLGGIRDVQRDGIHVTVGADNVTLSNDAAHPLKGPEVILAANKDVHVTSGSSIGSSGTPTSNNGDLIIEGSGAGADGALLRVSGGKQVAVVRDAPPGLNGSLTIDSGATVSADGSMTLDATKSLNNQGQVNLGSGAALGLGANRVSLGDAAPATVGGLRFDSAEINRLNQLSSLSLTSYSTFDTYGSIVLGSAAMQNLSLRGAGIQGFANAGDSVVLQANTVTLNGGGTYTPVSGAAAGSLSIKANDIELGSRTFVFNGYSNVNLTAQREVRAIGSGGNFSADSSMAVAAGRITALAGADVAVRSAQALALTQVANALAPLRNSELGGKLSFSGQSITSDALVVAHSGQVRLNADRGVHVTGGAIDVSGQAKAFGSTMAYSPGGNITLNGGTGDVIVDAPATLDVSATGANAGTIAVAATNGSNGTAVLNGTLRGGSTQGIDPAQQFAQGSISLDVDKLDAATTFGALNENLNSGGFKESRSFRVRNDDVTLAAGSTIVAHDALIEADNGNVVIDGKINASGAGRADADNNPAHATAGASTKGGSIKVFAGEASAGAGKGLLSVNGVMEARSTANPATTSAAGSAGNGGNIVLGTSIADGSASSSISDASINLANTATLDVSGATPAKGGTVQLRAPRVGSGAGSDVAITALDATITGSRATSIEAYKVYTAETISANADSATNLQVANASGGPAGAMYNDTNQFVSNINSGSAVTRLGLGGGAVALTPGIEVRSTGDLTVSVNELGAPQNRGWNLNGWRFNGQPGVLTLRAANNLVVNGSISDGFTQSASAAMPDWALDSSGPSWSYRLGGGNNLAAANPLATVASANAGDVQVSFARTSDFSGTDSPVAMVRTGTGYIDVAAGRDVVLDTLDLTQQKVLNGDYRSVTWGNDTLLGASIYTAGVASGPQPVTPPSNSDNAAYGSTAPSPAQFTQGGGSISLYAERNVNGPVTPQLINNWLFRQGLIKTDSSGNTVFASRAGGRGGSIPEQFTAWWSRFDYFNEGIATLGGGDITVRANTGNVVDLSASTATNAYYTSVGSTPIENGGGDLSVKAGGDILGGTFYVQKGGASLAAQGDIKAGNYSPAGTALLPVLALGDAVFNVVAGGDLEIEGAINPMLTTQSKYNAGKGTKTPNVALPDLSSTNLIDQFSYFSTYSNTSAVHLTSVTGDVVLSENVKKLSDAGGPDQAFNYDSLSTNAYKYLYLVQPGTFTASALSGDLSFEHGFSLAPSPIGQLELLANGSLKAKLPVDISNGIPALSGVTQPIVMIDQAPDSFMPVSAPYFPSAESSGPLGLLLTGGGTGINYHTAGGLHAGDANPARVIALNGDIDFSDYKAQPATLVLDKKAEIIAGNDIINAGFDIQQLAATDVTTVTAGRDLIVTNQLDKNLGSSLKQMVSGPGRIDFTTGRDFDLGNSFGVETRGNLDNPYLPAQGAAINVVAGATPDYAGFAKTYTSASELPVSEQTALVAFMQQYDTALPANLSPEDAWIAFNALPLTQRRPFLDSLFFDALARSAGAIGGSTLDLAKFDNIIASLFPATSIGAGNINVFGSQLKTDRGGAIHLFAPGGSVYAGLVSIPTYLQDKAKSSAERLGIFTIGGGPIYALVRKDFLVNQGRVFTLGGGDITLVSQYGNIDAGRGTKTAQASPPPILITDSNGNTQVDISGAISGSGIATLRTGPNVPASNVYPIAPRGIFDAGDAGVRSTGSVNIVAAVVLNASNITAAGSVSGAQTAVSGLSGSVAAPSNAPATKTDNIASLGSDQQQGNTLTVELLGYGVVNGQETVTEDGQNDDSLDCDSTDKKNKKCSKNK